MIRSKSRRGSAILSVVIVLLIIMVLTQGYMAPVAPGGKSFNITVTDRARSAAAAMNFRGAQTAWISRTQGRRLEIQQLRQELDQLSSTYGSGGRFFVLNGQDLRITTDIQTRKFEEDFPLERVR